MIDKFHRFSLKAANLSNLMIKVKSIGIVVDES
jgi:hypothetical protein